MFALTGGISTVDVSGLTAIVTDNIAAILPTGIAIMGAMLGVAMIPKIIKRFM